MTTSAPPPPARPRRLRLLVVLLILAALALYVRERIAHPAGVELAALAETEPVPSDGDAADDVAIWVHPTRPELSTLLGTDKKAGLAVYDLDGRQLQFAAHGEINNVDLRQGLTWGAGTADLAAATNKSRNAIALYRLADDGRSVELLGEQTLSSAIEAEGICLYRSPADHSLYAFVTGKQGRIEQWRVAASAAGAPVFTLARGWDTGEELEGCVADDETGRLYIGAENVGVWSFDAEPQGATAQPHLVDSTDLLGHLRHDVEGLALYRQADGGGYLVVSSQGSDDFVVYDRRPPHAYRGRFRVALGRGDAADGLTHTDGIEVTSAGLGPRFAQGLFVAQDDDNDPANQNFKLVPWASIAAALELDADT